MREARNVFSVFLDAVELAFPRGEAWKSAISFSLSVEFKMNKISSKTSFPVVLVDRSSKLWVVGVHCSSLAPQYFNGNLGAICLFAYYLPLLL